MPETRLSMMNARRALGVLAALALLMLGCEASQDRAAPDGADSIRLRSDGERLGDRSGEIQEALLVEDSLARAERLSAILQTLEPEALEDALAAYDTVYLDIGDFELEMLADDRAALASLPRRLIVFYASCGLLALVMLFCEHTFASAS